MSIFPFPGPTTSITKLVHGGVHSAVDSASRHDETRHNDVLVHAAGRSLSGIERKSVVSVSQVLDMRETGRVNVLDYDGFAEHYRCVHLSSPDKDVPRLHPQPKGVVASSDIYDCNTYVIDRFSRTSIRILSWLIIPTALWLPILALYVFVLERVQ